MQKKNLFKKKIYKLEKHIQANPDHFREPQVNKTPTKSKDESLINQNLQHSIKTMIEAEQGQESLIVPDTKVRK